MSAPAFKNTHATRRTPDHFKTHVHNAFENYFAQAEVTLRGSNSVGFRLWLYRIGVLTVLGLTLKLMYFVTWIEFGGVIVLSRRLAQKTIG